MTVALVMFVLAFFSFWVKKGRQYKYLLFAAFILSLLYLFFVPPQSYDLKRHYDTLDYIKGLDIRQVYDISYGKGNGLLALYQKTSKAYVLYAFIISRIPVPHLLVSVTCFIIYGLSVKRIVSVGESIKASSFAAAAAFSVLLCSLEYRSVSGIRNMLAYAVFAFVIYADLVEKKNKILCFALYMILCEVHMVVPIFVALRLAVIIGHKALKWALIIMALAAFTIRDVALAFLERYSASEFVSDFLGKNHGYIRRYEKGIAVYYYRYAYSLLAFIVVMLLIYLVCKNYRLMEEKMDAYNLFFVMTIAITIGAVRQYDFLYRNCMLIAFLAIPYTVRFFNSVVLFNKSTVILRIPGSNRLFVVPIVLVIFAGIIYTALFYIHTCYIPMDGHFSGL